jgi:hypothetical protein
MMIWANLNRQKIAKLYVDLYGNIHIFYDFSQKVMFEKQSEYICLFFCFF